MWRRRRPAAVLLAAAVPLAACAEDQPLLDGGPEVPGGAVGPDVVVTEDLELLQVQIEYPLDGVHEEGEDARLYLGIANTGNDDAELADVTGEDFASAALIADGGPGVIPVPGNDNVYVGGEGGPSIVLEDLERSLRSSESVPVTFVFAEAGQVTVDFPDPAEDPTSDN